MRSREIELAKQAEDREDKRLEYEANAGKRTLDMQERKLDIVEREVNANRKAIDEYNNYLRIQRNVEQIKQAIDIQRDAAAARLGITREQYDRLLYEKNYYGREY